MQVRLILFLFILGFAGLCFINWYLHRGPELTGRATVLSHRADPTRVGGGRYSGGGWNYYVTFRLSDGEEIELSVFEEQFSSLKKGMTGMLIWEGTDFCSFEEEDVR